MNYCAQRVQRYTQGILRGLSTARPRLYDLGWKVEEHTARAWPEYHSSHWPHVDVESPFGHKHEYKLRRLLSPEYCIYMSVDEGRVAPKALADLVGKPFETELRSPRPSWGFHPLGHVQADLEALGLDVPLHPRLVRLQWFAHKSEMITELHLSFFGYAAVLPEIKTVVIMDGSGELTGAWAGVQLVEGLSANA